MFQKVKVNTFQKNFDSIWRNFTFNWNQGNFFKYLLNRYQWYRYPNTGKVSSFPLHVDIETTAKCNLRCGMCPSRQLSEERYGEYGNMEMDLFKKLIDECDGNGVFSVRLSWRGEVLVNKRFVDYVHYAKIVKKIPNVSFLTNGSLLKGEVAEKLIEYGLDYISVSIDGLDDVYEKIRYPLKFQDVYTNLANFKILLKKKGKKKPVIRITTLWPSIAKDPKAFYDRLYPVCNKIVYNPLKDYTVSEPQKKGFICQFPWERLFIGFDGKVQPCSITTDSFVIGDAAKSSLKEIWHSDRMLDLRKAHSELRRLDIFPCNKCSYGIDYSILWKDRNWTKWNPEELNQLSKGNQ